MNGCLRVMNGDSKNSSEEGGVVPSIYDMIEGQLGCKY